MGVEFAGGDGTQMFVQASDPEAVLAAIETYVDEHGCEGMYEAVDDRLDARTARRTERRFDLAPAQDGWVAVWEDGSSADRRLAQDLSESLTTTVHWLMVSSSTDSWAHWSFTDGTKTDSAIEEDVDGVERAAQFASVESLPHALTFLGDPTLGNVLAGLEVPALQDLGIDMSDVIADLPTAGGGPKGTITRSFRCGA